MTTTHYKQRRHEEAVARVRAQTTLIESWREAVARRDRLAAEHVEACELVADCTVDIEAATEASAGAIAEVLGVSKGTVLHQLRAGRALRDGDPVPRRQRGGRSEREKRAARRRAELREERMAEPGAAERARELHEAAQRLEPGFAGALSALTGEPADELRRLGFGGLAEARPQEVPAPEGFEESLAAFREARRTGGQPAAEALLRERIGLAEWETPVGPPIGPAEEVRP